MSMEWKDKTCEKCKFRVGGECRRFPPVIEVEVDVVGSTSYMTYPVVKWDQNDYMPACAEYKEESVEDEWNRRAGPARSATPKTTFDFDEAFRKIKAGKKVRPSGTPYVYMLNTSEDRLCYMVDSSSPPSYGSIAAMRIKHMMGQWEDAE